MEKLNTKPETTTKEHEVDQILDALKATFDKVDFKLPTFSPADLFDVINEGDDIQQIREWAVNEKGLKIGAFNNAIKC